MRVIGYAYDADLHCVSCTRKYVEANWFKNFPQDKFKTFHEEYKPNIDGVLSGDIDFSDSESNPIHPIFSTDELSNDPEHCSDCGEELE